ncbi:VanZ family protein [Coprobacillus sp. AM09-26]|nr:VanZ family protein [Faecalibacillus intestinalis]RGF27179.1 VanZ family protein [Coprobacillus sp. AM09-26]
MQLVLCRGMFDVDDIIHNSLGFLIGISISNRILRKGCK